MPSQTVSGSMGNGFRDNYLILQKNPKHPKAFKSSHFEPDVFLWRWTFLLGTLLDAFLYIFFSPNNINKYDHISQFRSK